MSPTHGHFFSSGGTLSSGASSYISRAADEQIFAALNKGRYCFLLNPRQMGKSSLSVHTIARLKEAGTRSLLIDLTRIGGKNVTADQWYATLCRELANGLGIQFDLRKFWQAQGSITPMRRFFTFIEEVVLGAVSGPIVLFLDEVDATMNLSFSSDEFFAGIREMYNRRSDLPEFNRFTVCLVGVALPSDLIKDARVTPFNIGERIYLQDFTLDEVSTYSPVLGPNGRSLVERIHYWTNGHPFLTQSLCASIQDSGTTSSPSDIDQMIERELLSPEAAENNINLVDIANRALNAGASSEKPDHFRAELLTIYEAVLKGKHVIDDESNRACAMLKLSGLVRSENGRLSVRNRVYRKVFDRSWIQANMPHQEVVRQKRAYRRGLLIAGSIGTVVGVAIIGLAAYSVKQAKIASQKTLEADRAAAAARKAAGSAYSAELRASAREQDARLAEQRALSLLNERNSALKSSQEAGEREKKARVESDRLRDLSQRLSFQTTNLVLQEAFQKFNEGSEGPAMRTLADLQRQDNHDWEYRYIAHQVHRFGRYFRASPVRICGLGYIDKDRLATLSTEGVLAIWNASTLSPLNRFNISQSCLDMHVSPSEGSAIVGQADSSVVCVSLADGRIRWRKSGIVPALSQIVLSRNGKTFLAISSQPRALIAVCNVLDGRKISTIELGRGSITTADYSPDGSMFTVAGNALDGHRTAFQSVFRVTPLQRLWMRKDRTGDQATCLSFRSDGNILVARPEGRVSRVDVRTAISTGEKSAEGKRTIASIVPLASDRWALTRWQSRNDANDGGIQFFSEGSERSLNRGVDRDLQLATGSPDGTLVATADDDGGVYLWSAPARPEGEERFGELVGSFPKASLHFISPDGRFVAALDSGRHEMALFESGSGRPIVKLGGVTGRPIFSPAGEFLAVRGQSQNSRIVSLHDGLVLRSIRGSVPLSFSSDGQELLLADVAHIRLVEWRSERIIADISIGQSSATVGALSRDGRLAAIALSDHRVLVASIFTSNTQLIPMGVPKTVQNDLVFSLDGRRLFTAGSDFAVREWDTSSGKPVAVLSNSSFSYPECLQAHLMADGKRLVVAGRGPISVWDIETGKLLLAIPRNAKQESVGELADSSLVSIGTDGKLFRMGIEARN